MENKLCPFCGKPSDDLYGDCTCKDCIHADDTGKAYIRPEVWNNRPGEDKLRKQLKDLVWQNKVYQKTIDTQKLAIEFLETEIKWYEWLLCQPKKDGVELPSFKVV